jgi:hypothetical protein
MNQEHDRFNQFEETVQEMLKMDAITPVDAQRYRQNFRFFLEQRPYLERTHKCAWVASIEGQFYNRFYLRDLHKTIEEIPFSDRAYIEHIHAGGSEQINLLSHNINPPKPLKPTSN